MEGRPSLSSGSTGVRPSLSAVHPTIMSDVDARAAGARPVRVEVQRRNVARAAEALVAIALDRALVAGGIPVAVTEGGGQQRI